MSAPDAPALLTSPTGGSTLSGASVTFNWSAGTNATLYELNVSTFAGGANIANVTTAGTSTLVTGLPVDGSTVYARLWTKYASTWEAVAYTFTAATSNAPALLTSPANASTLSGASVTFNWSAGTNATLYELNVSTFAGGVNIANVQTVGTSTLVTGLPTNGSTVYARLWTKYASTWEAVTYTFTASNSTPDAPAQLTSPTDASTLSGASVTFNWSAGTNATQYWLEVSTFQGGTNLENFDAGTALSRLVTGIPVDGRAIYARLWTKYASTWAVVSYSFTAANAAPNAPAQLTSPAGGSTLSGASVTFNWSAGTNATLYELNVSTFAGGVNIANVQTVGTSTLVTGIPVDGRTIYARLWTKYASTWEAVTYTFTAATPDTPAQMTSPASGSTLSGASVTFNWSAGSNATLYELNVSTFAGGTDIANVQTAGTSTLVTGIPVDGRTIYARLWTKYASTWEPVAYTFTAATTNIPAQLTSPAGGSTLPGASMTFNWSAGTNATLYELNVSTFSGGANIANVQTASTSTVVSGLPTDGSTVYARLWTKYASTWEPVAYTFTAANAASLLSIYAGESHTCALTGVSGVKCWGLGSSGRIGDGASTTRVTPVAVTGLTSGVLSLAAGRDFNCAVTSTGGAKCWGNNFSGKLGDGSSTNRTTPMDVSGLTSGVAAVAAGRDHACALTTGGGVKCWGLNDYGELGDGTTDSTNTNPPVNVSGLTSGVAAIAAGDNHTCALTTGGGVKCWGSNGRGQLGTGAAADGDPHSVAADVSGLTSGVAAITAGAEHTCARTTGGGLKCWGYNAAGQIGDSSNASRVAPVDVIGMTSGMSAVAAGDNHTCAVTSGGAAKCWGVNSHGTLGDGTTANAVEPVSVTGLTTGVTGITGGSDHSCAVLASGSATCWGWNGIGYGMLGDGSATNSSTAVDVSGLTSGVSAISAGGFHGCALTSGGGVKCWGLNNFGQLGDNSQVMRLSPVDVSGLASGVSAIASGDTHSCALISGGTVKCWGGNSNGKVGDDTATNRLTPVNVKVAAATNLTGVGAITAGDTHTCALITGTGGVKCWGGNVFGEIGDSTNVSRDMAVDVTGLTSGVAAIVAGDDHTCALTTGGGVKCWGANSRDQLGNGLTTASNIAVDVTGLASGVAAITAGGDHTCALTTGGGVKCWGYNARGQIGVGNTTTPQLTAVDVSGLASGVAAISVRGEESCALTTGGGMKCWGYSGTGQLGDGTLVQKTTPTNVSGLTSGVSAISVGGSHACALVSGGAKCWGSLEWGQVGNGTAGTHTTPVTVAP